MERNKKNCKGGEQGQRKNKKVESYRHESSQQGVSLKDVEAKKFTPAHRDESKNKSPYLECVTDQSGLCQRIGQKRGASPDDLVPAES